MGKALNGKELGRGVTQRKDGLYQGRFVNRFGKKQTIYAKTNIKRGKAEAKKRAVRRRKGPQCRFQGSDAG